MKSRARRWRSPRRHRGAAGSRPQPAYFRTRPPGTRRQDAGQVVATILSRRGPGWEVRRAAEQGHSADVHQHRAAKYFAQAVCRRARGSTPRCSRRCGVDQGRGGQAVDLTWDFSSRLRAGPPPPPPPCSAPSGPASAGPRGWRPDGSEEADVRGTVSRAEPARGQVKDLPLPLRTADRRRSRWKGRGYSRPPVSPGPTVRPSPTLPVGRPDRIHQLRAHGTSRIPTGNGRAPEGPCPPRCRGRSERLRKASSRPRSQANAARPARSLAQAIFGGAASSRERNAQDARGRPVWRGCRPPARRHPCRGHDGGRNVPSTLSGNYETMATEPLLSTVERRPKAPCPRVRHPSRFLPNQSAWSEDAAITMLRPLPSRSCPIAGAVSATPAASSMRWSGRSRAGGPARPRAAKAGGRHQSGLPAA